MGQVLPVTPYTRTFLDDASAAEAVATLGLFTEQVVILTGSNVTTTNTVASPANVTGMSFPVAINSTYLVTGMMTVQSASTTIGIGFGFTLPASATMSLAFNHATGTTTTMTGQAITAGAIDLPTTAINPANTNCPALFTAIIKTAGTSGTAQLVFSNETGATQVTVVGGSLSAMFVKKIG